MPNRTSRSQHDKIVRYIHDHLIQQGYNDVRADLPKFTRPERIPCTENDGHTVPDVTGRRYGLNIYVVETDESIFGGHTEDQWTRLAAYARAHMARFWVVVPKGSGDSAEQRMRELGILANLWEVRAT